MKQGIDLAKYIEEEEEITLDKLMPKKFYINREGDMVGEITIGQLNIISILLIELQEDNNRLNKELENLEKLNNIINEFEEELKWQRKVSLSLNESFAVSRIDTLINKLQELKGEDKE